ncbi:MULTISPECIES: hypothetical protein [Streptomyces]|uniref:hypothetical protein n=1 Tax=Streptomyces TaxID=1883 RepID=UPI00287FD864|nr:hypothetical protein [Streptomyces sp. CGMCC 4.1456]WNF66017.1 hypothetical protein RJD14_27010 [Streptomyces sp. CGMCC 4.1456]
MSPGEPGSGPLPGIPVPRNSSRDSTQDAIAPAGPLQIGGYAWEEAIYTDPVADAASHAVKAAEAGRWDGPVSGDVSDWESASVHWVIQREDLAARRFDRAFTDVFWNP